MHDLHDTVDLRVWNDIAVVCIKSLKVIWWVGLGIALASFVAVAGEQGLELRSELKTEYGLDKEKNSEGGAKE